MKQCCHATIGTCREPFFSFHAKIGTLCTEQGTIHRVFSCSWVVLGHIEPGDVGAWGGRCGGAGLDAGGGSNRSHLAAYRSSSGLCVRRTTRGDRAHAEIFWGANMPRTTSMCGVIALAAPEHGRPRRWRQQLAVGRGVSGVHERCAATAAATLA